MRTEPTTPLAAALARAEAAERERSRLVACLNTIYGILDGSKAGLDEEDVWFMKGIARAGLSGYSQ